MKPGEILHSVSRGTFWLALERVAALLSGVAYVALLSRWLGPTKYGIMALAIAFTGLAATATGNFEEFLERYAAEYEARGLILTLRRAHLLALGLKLGLGVLASALLLALTPMLQAQFHVPELGYLIPVLVVTVVFDGFATTGRATLYGIQQFRWVSAVAVVFHVVKTVMVGLLWWTRHGLVDLAIGLSALAVAQGVAQTAIPLWMMRRAEDREPHEPARDLRGLLRSMLRYCLPLLGARVAFLSGQNLSKIILGKLFEPYLLGYFSFASLTIERFVQLAQTLPASLLPSLTRLVAKFEHQRLRLVFDQSLRLIQTLAALLSIGVFVFARELTLLVGSPLFENAIPMLRVLALVPVVRTAQQPLTMLFQSLGRTRTVLGLALIRFVTEFGCYLLLVTTLGIIGAAWANLAGAAVSYVVAMVLLNRTLPEGTRQRVRTGLIAGVLPLPLVAACLLLEWRVQGYVLVPLHLALAVLAVLLAFGLGLVWRSDLEKLSAVPLEAAWARRLRDLVVGTLWLFGWFGGLRRNP